MRRPLILLLIIGLLALLLRTVDLEHVPVGSDGDVAWFSIHALNWVDRGVWPYYIREMYGPEPITVYLIGLATLLVGITNQTARLVTAFSGTAFVLVLFPAAWWLLGPATPRRLRIRAGLLAAFGAAISLHAVHISRQGLQAGQVPVIAALVFWATAYAWHKNRSWMWLLAGAALALTEYVYMAARVFPFAVLLWFLHDALFNREGFKTRWRGWVLMGVTSFLLVLPNLILYVTMPRSFSSRIEAATANTGGFIWNYDLSGWGGIPGMIGWKLLGNIRAFGLDWNGPFTSGVGQPVLSSLLLVGLLVTLVLLFRRPRGIPWVWPWLALPVMMVLDLLTSVSPSPHAIRLTGLLPSLFLLAGIGLAYLWDWLENRFPTLRARNVLVTGTVVILLILPSAWDFYRYFEVVTPARSADPRNSWLTEQADLDIAREIAAHPDRAYLIPYTEYERPVLAWITAGAYRDRDSAIAPDGTFIIPNPPSQLTVMLPADPYRVRHDGYPAQVDDRLWVLMQNGQTRFLPPLTDEQTAQVMAAVRAASPQVLTDRSNTDIARFYNIPAPAGLFAARNVLDRPLDALFNAEIRLVGYTVPSEDLTPGRTFFATFYWKVEKVPSTDYEVLAQVWNDAGQSVAQWQNVPYGGNFQTSAWRTGEIIATHHWLRLPDDAPAGRYTLVAALFHPLKAERLPVEGSSADPQNQVVRMPDLRLLPPKPQISLPSPPAIARFGDVLRLSGLGLQSIPDVHPPVGEMSLKAGGDIRVQLAWTALTRPPVDYSVFLHLTPEGQDAPAAQADSLIRADFPTGAWRANEVWTDAVTLRLPPDLKPGRYRLWMGVYYWQTGERLPVMVDGVTQPDGRLRLATIIVTR